MPLKCNVQDWTQGTSEEGVAVSGRQTVVVALIREANVGRRKGDRFNVFREPNGQDLVMNQT